MPHAPRPATTRRRSRLAAIVVGTAAWTGLLVAAGALPQAAADSHEASATDVRFATMMVRHHQMGIELTQMAIDKTTNPEIRELAQREQESQRSQLPTLEAIAASGSQPHEQEEPLMTFNDQQMAELQSLSGEAFDKMWLDVFSSHHMAAIMMADTALPGAAAEEARAVQQEIHDGQLEAVSEMNRLREQVGGQQVSQVPTGAAETGGGSTSTGADTALVATGGGLVLAGAAGGAYALRRRATSTGR